MQIYDFFQGGDFKHSFMAEIEVNFKMGRA